MLISKHRPDCCRGQKRKYPSTSQTPGRNAGRNVARPTSPLSKGTPAADKGVVGGGGTPQPRAHKLSQMRVTNIIIQAHRRPARHIRQVRVLLPTPHSFPHKDIRSERDVIFKSAQAWRVCTAHLHGGSACYLARYLARFTDERVNERRQEARRPAVTRRTFCTQRVTRDGTRRDAPSATRWVSLADYTSLQALALSLPPPLPLPLLAGLQ